MEAAFILNAGTLAGVAAILSALAGAIAFLFKVVVASKDSEISALRAQLQVMREDNARQHTEFEQRLVAQRQAHEAREAQMAAATERLQNLLFESIPALRGLTEAVEAQTRQNRPR